MIYACDLYNNRKTTRRLKLQDKDYFIDTMRYGRTQLLSVVKRHGVMWARVHTHTTKVEETILHGWYKIYEGAYDSSPVKPHDFKNNRRF